jgi:hypothetical protein
MSDWEFQDNHMGEKPEIDIPRPPIANDPEFGVQRMLDGHKYPGDENTALNQDWMSNIHNP